MEKAARREREGGGRHSGVLLPSIRVHSVPIGEIPGQPGSEFAVGQAYATTEAGC